MNRLRGPGLPGGVTDPRVPLDLPTTRLTPRRFARLMARGRWAIISLAILGGLAAGGLAWWWNQGIDPRFEAIATIGVLQLEGEEDYEQRVETMAGEARSVLAERLAADRRLRVESAPDTGSINFLSTAASSEEAATLAEGLRNDYLDANASGLPASQVREALSALEQQIARVRADYEALTISGGDSGTDALRTTLQGQLSALQQRASALIVDITQPALTASERSALEGQLREVEERVQEVARDLADLPAGTTDNASRLQTLVLEQQLRTLESRYVEQSLELLELAGAGGVLEDVTVVDRTPAQRPMLQVALLGTLIGMLLAGAGLVAVDRIRPALMSPEDLRWFPVVEETTRARPGASTSQPWYTSAPNARRREALQRLRAMVNPLIEGSFSSLAVCGIGTSLTDARLVGADLAVAMAATGRRVLLIDACLGEQPLTETASDGADLSEILTAEVYDGDERTYVKTALAHRHELAADLLAVSAGSLHRDGVDLLAGQRFRIVLQEAAELADAAVVLGPLLPSAAGEASLQATDAHVIVTAYGRTALADVERFLLRTSGHSYPAGVIMLRGGRTRRPRARKSRSRGRRARQHR